MLLFHMLLEKTARAHNVPGCPGRQQGTQYHAADVLEGSTRQRRQGEDLGPTRRAHNTLPIPIPIPYQTMPHPYWSTAEDTRGKEVSGGGHKMGPPPLFHSSDFKATNDNF